MLGASAPAMHGHAAGLTTVTDLHYSVHTWEKTAAKEKHADNQGPWNCLWAQIRLYFLSPASTTMLSYSPTSCTPECPNPILLTSLHCREDARGEPVQPWDSTLTAKASVNKPIVGPGLC